MTDYRTLLGKAIQQHPYPMDAADFLATRIPWLCHDCNEAGWSTVERPYPQTCTHPNAPTIEDLLHWGEKVAQCKPQMRVREGEIIHVATPLRSHTKYAIHLLEFLRTEADCG